MDSENTRNPEMILPKGEFIMAKYTRKDIKELVSEEDVEFIRLQFVDIYGILKNVAVTASQLERILNNELTFDCGAIEGLENKNLSKLILAPDLDTFAIFPWRPQSNKVARFICDVQNLDGSPFEKDSRNVLKTVLKKAAKEGYFFNVGPELEFFLFDTDENGGATCSTNEKGSIFDVGPVDQGENARRDMVLSLSDMGFEIEASYHSDEAAQHQIDFKYASPLNTADNIMTFKLAVHTVAKRHGLHATFMPKPRTDLNGSGLHTHITIYKDGNNIFTGGADGGCSMSGYSFMAGILRHMPGMMLINNPIINSYKRLYTMLDKMTAYNCSEGERYALLQMTDIGRMGAGIVLRSPDAACNPYLMFAAVISSGMDGIKNKMELDFDDGYVKKLPRTLEEALKAFDGDEYIKGIFGKCMSDKILMQKSREWSEYCRQVSSWEIERYLDRI